MPHSSLPAAAAPPDLADLDRYHIGQLVREGHFEEALSFLASGGCDGLSEQDWIDQDMARNRTPLVLICDNQYKWVKDADGNRSEHPLANALIEALLKAGCPTVPVDDYGVNALNYAAGSRDLPKVELLLAAGADPNSPGAEFSPVILALMSKREGAAATAWRLLMAGASLDDKSIDFDGNERPSAHESIANLNAWEGAGIDSSVLTAFDEWKALQPASGSEPSPSVSPPRL